ncbi:hypothetical protein [Fuerstiella marisgermanici]|uniref:Uncharacterized protein n=1 Tax=Fuerstiella marisgermanici TaxID=1891926 RepID=A0A1P8WQM9_9PLAN|nr:hypothetical protein [Fuerstiella marisgermanici]APZ96366.1 hypothetical protein Fuma_06035 [Fuerstiella marisgermanici]
MPRRRTRRITGRDRRILNHLAEFHSATVDVLHRRFFAEKKVEAVRSTLRRLSTGPHQVVQSVPLDGRRAWYQLTPQGARFVGHKSYDCRTLGLHATARQFALQWFLFLAEEDLRLVNLHDFPDLFPVRGHRLPQGRFYFRTQSGIEPTSSTKTEERRTSTVQRLGYLAFDFGGRPLRIAQRLQQTLRRFLMHGWFDSLIQDGQFEVTLLTINASRRRSYDHTLPDMLHRNLATQLARFHTADSKLPSLAFPVTSRSVPGLHDIIYGRSPQ